MLAVQSWLAANGGNYELLEKQLGIKATFHPTDSRVILNYSMIDSPKAHPCVVDCRGLVLNRHNYEIVAKAFPRFFNAGEMLDLHKNFIWEHSEALDKEDGSLVLTYMFNGEPHLNTRGSFGYGEINSSGISWRMLMDIAVPNWKEIQLSCFPGVTLVWELCSRYNKVVRDYAQPTAYLLSAFENENEKRQYLVDDFATRKSLNRPVRYIFSCLDEVMQFIAKRAENDPTYEGLVIRDVNGMRLKCKSNVYISLHRLKNNGNVINPKNIIPLILNGETAEVCTYFPELEPNIRKYEVKLAELKTQLENIWHCFWDTQKDKDFAKEALTSPLSSLLFRARKNGGHPLDYLTESKELLIKVLS